MRLDRALETTLCVLQFSLAEVAVDERFQWVLGAKKVVPEGARNRQGRMGSFQVAVRSLGVRAAAATSLGGLVLAHERFNTGTHDGCECSPEEATEASGELEGAHVSRGVAFRGLQDPSQYVHGRAKAPVNDCVINFGSVESLTKQTRDKVDAVVKDFVGNAVMAWGRSRWLRYDSGKAIPRRWRQKI